MSSNPPVTGSAAAPVTGSGAGTAGVPPVPLTAPAAEMVTVTIDGQAKQFPKGTNLLEACNATGCDVPFFCYHAGLSSPAVCRQCLVDVKGQPKPVPSCYTPVADKMEVTTNSPRVLDIRRQMLEFTLVNHPIDCPICDKAGECSLQRQYFDWDAKYARNDGIKVHKDKVVDLGKHIVLDQERCILCTRCIRVCEEVAKQPELTMAMRGDHEVLTTAPGKRLDNPYSLNTVDVCPVGALTAKDFRFSMRVWELQSTPSVCTGCATGCNDEVQASRNVVHRLIPRINESINKHWMCDEGRFTYKALTDQRQAVPLIKGSPVTWDRALDEAGKRLKDAVTRAPGSVAVVFSAQSTNEDLHVLARLCETLKISKTYLAANPDGWSDDILVSADKNPNTAGARAIGGGSLKTLADLDKDLKSGAVTTLLVVNDEGGFAHAGAAGVKLNLDKVETVVALASHTGPLVDGAHVVLPLAMWAEVDGTITNKKGVVQRIRRAIEPAGDSLPGWEILAELGSRLDVAIEHETPKKVFLDAQAKHAFMKGAEWGRPILPVQLRFANTRG
jgi:NADH-quinone oxidoreductase subunit G